MVLTKHFKGHITAFINDREVYVSTAVEQKNIESNQQKEPKHMKKNLQILHQMTRKVQITKISVRGGIPSKQSDEDTLVKIFKLINNTRSHPQVCYKKTCVLCPQFSYIHQDMKFGLVLVSGGLLFALTLRTDDWQKKMSKLRHTMLHLQSQRKFMDN